MTVSDLFIDLVLGKMPKSRESRDHEHQCTLSWLRHSSALQRGTMLTSEHPCLTLFCVALDWHSAVAKLPKTIRRAWGPDAKMGAYRSLIWSLEHLYAGLCGPTIISGRSCWDSRSSYKNIESVLAFCLRFTKHRFWASLGDDAVDIDFCKLLQWWSAPSSYCDQSKSTLSSNAFTEVSADHVTYSDRCSQQAEHWKASAFA